MNTAPAHPAPTAKPAPAPGIDRAAVAFASLAYAALAAHLLFIPYALSALPFDLAIERYTRIEWYELGSDQNVALVSRAIMWLPLGLLLAMTVAPRPRHRLELPALLVATFLSCAWAVVVNFGQLWFPGRTVSLNNLAAEACGGLAGALLWSLFGAAILRWWRRLASGGMVGLQAALGGYVAVYLVVILTPFDFITGMNELMQKIDSRDLYAWWLAPIGCGPSSCNVKMTSVVLACVPCGWWFAARRPNERHAWLPAAVLALLIGTLVELLHFLMVSGVSQGSSIIARAAGMALGAMTYPGSRRLTTLDLDRWGRRAVMAAALPYLAAAFYVGGWLRSARLAPEAGLARATEITWMPFYQEYYAPYHSTMLSAMVIVALYVPMGAACWAWARDRRQVPLWTAALAAAAVSFVVESSKLWLADRLPDYTDVFIAAGTALVTLAVLRLATPSPAPGWGSHAPDRTRQRAHAL